MSEQNTIPQNNLPIYLQEYTISVLGNLDSVDCTVAPKDEVGTIQYSTLGVIPSNVKDARVWDLKASGTLKPHDKDYIIHYDLSKVDYKGKVTFENELSGVITLCGRVISISKKNATYLICEETKTVSIIIDQSRWGFSIIKETPFSMDIQIDDATSIPGAPELFCCGTTDTNGNPLCGECDGGTQGCDKTTACSGKTVPCSLFGTDNPCKQDPAPGTDPTPEKSYSCCGDGNCVYTTPDNVDSACDKVASCQGEECLTVEGYVSLTDYANNCIKCTETQDN